MLATIDRFAYEKSLLINVGPEKGALLDAAVRRADPKLALELGTYCGYGALRIARAAPGAKVYSVELAEANAVNARQIWAHAGVADRVTCVVGTIGDGGGHLTRWPPNTASSPARWTSCSSTTTRTPTCPTCRASSTAAGCTVVRLSSPTMSGIPARPSTAPTCERSRASGGTPLSTRHTWSTRH
ncbi:O-methyltransferase family protein [Mycobacterium xenopi 4042]|uniref:O-methyltransferase family protein n=1 Tax=Mycobacterium xenopi 4042 TaxID=1299334 RepID=X8BHU6_MYCXE|nr:O-methyltransferase family protein [Mycobacterium xenopi 3993]EUA42773.1 O-methyltransferase family protein [Mycobacterium xenopi 4042]